MILISSTGGSASTSLMGWFSRRCDCNCPVNSEGIRRKGPGSNPKGLKHRCEPPHESDPYLLRKNSFDRTNVSEGPITRALFVYDTPFAVIPSLFRRRIANGHLRAMTGNKPPHENTIDSFLNYGQDTFHLYKQFENWTNYNETRTYKRMLVNFSHLWEYIDYILEFLEIDESHLKNFPKKRKRVNRFNELDINQQQKLSKIYGTLDQKMQDYPKLVVI